MIFEEKLKQIGEKLIVKEENGSFFISGLSKDEMKFVDDNKERVEIYLKTL